MCPSGQALGPSESAFAGSGWVSMNTPAMPAGHRRAREHRHEFALPAARGALPARQLHRMRGIEHHRAAGIAHDHERAHVGDEVVVAEGHAALAHQDVVAPCWPISPSRRRSSCRPGARNWPFLMFTGLPVAATAQMKSVWRHRKAGVCSTSTTSAAAGDLFHLVHVGQDRDSDLPLDFIQDLKTFFYPQATKGLYRCPVRLVVGRLVDERKPRPAQISFNSPAVSIASCRDSTTHGPAITKSGLSSPASNPHSFIAAVPGRRQARSHYSPVTRCFSGARLLAGLRRGRPRLGQRGLDERLEQRMAVPRASK